MKTTGKQWQKIQLLESPNLQNGGCLIQIRQTVYFKLIPLVFSVNCKGWEDVNNY